MGAAMKEEEIRDLVRRRIGEIAPEADMAALDPACRFRDQFDFDSIDFLNLALALQQDLGITIPENEYPRLATLDSCVAYLVESCAAA
jgi:acyl carrier protein